MENRVIIFIELTDADFIIILQAAQIEGISRSELIKKAINKYIKEVLSKRVPAQVTMSEVKVDEQSRRRGTKKKT